MGLRATQQDLEARLISIATREREAAVSLDTLRNKMRGLEATLIRSSLSRTRRCRPRFALPRGRRHHSLAAF